MFIYENPESEISAISRCAVDRPLDEPFERHMHESYELIMLSHGSVKFNIDGRELLLAPYDLIIIPPFTYHFTVPFDNSIYENYVIRFGEGIAGIKYARKRLYPQVIENVSKDSFLRHLFYMFEYSYQNYSPEDFYESACYLLNEILLCVSYIPLRKSDTTDYIPSDNNIVPEIVSYINNNLDSELNCGVLEQKIGYSKSYIKNRFSAVMGIGLQHYINMKKIYAAHHDLQNGVSPIEAAYKYCYGDYSSFYRQYIKIMGFSPKQTANKK